MTGRVSELASYWWLLCICLAPVHGNEPKAGSFIRTIYAEFVDDAAGHFDFGVSIGLAVGDFIRSAWSSDSELHAMEQWVESNSVGRKVFQNVIEDSNRSFPLYMREVEGMAKGSSIPLQRFLLNQLRTELLQFLPVRSDRKRRGKCTDAFVFDPATGTAAWGHNDDWAVNWRESAYIVKATVLNPNMSVKVKFASWLYPGYLAGMDVTFNSHGVAYTVNSLFPKNFSSSGVGTTFVSRHVAESHSVSDAIARAADTRVSTAMNYNIGDINTKRMIQLEVDTHGKHMLYQITGPDFHANQFRHLQTRQFPEPSTSHRYKRWKELEPATVDGIRHFLSDSQDPQWPVYRNSTGADNCFTDATGLFDLERRSLHFWNTRSSESPPLVTFDLSFGNHNDITSTLILV